MNLMIRLKRKAATTEEIARAENPFLTAFSREKLVEAVPVESVRLQRKSKINYYY